MSILTFTHLKHLQCQLVQLIGCSLQLTPITDYHVCSIRNTAWLILQQGCCSCVCAASWDGKSPLGNLILWFVGLQLNDAPLAIVDKRRSSHNVSEVMNLIGDVKDKVAVLVDDMIDTAGTITNAAKVSMLMQQF